LSRHECHLRHGGLAASVQLQLSTVHRARGSLPEPARIDLLPALVSRETFLPLLRRISESAARCLLASVGIAACSSEFTSCPDSRSCISRTSGSAGSHGGSEDGGMSFGGSAGSGMAGASANGGTGDAGAAGSPACADTCKGLTPVCDVVSSTCVQCLKGTDCKDSSKPTCDVSSNNCVQCLATDCKNAAKPVCDTAANTCVGCLGNEDCKDAAKPLCDTAGAQCVACLKQADCTSATASACSAGACTACTTDAGCSNIAGKGVCDAGTCVQCTAAKESVCGGKSCDPATKACTTTGTGSVTMCRACVADSECVGGNSADADARCVPMSFKGVPRPGGFCLRPVSKTCGSPYKIVINATSLSGAPPEDYCGIAQDLTRCEAVLDLLTSKACPDMKDSSCGCQRDASGACVTAGLGGLCRKVGPDQNHCTYECGSATQCSGGYACDGSPTLYCQ